MAVLSPVFLLLLVSFLEFGKSAADDCIDNGGVCIPFFEGVNCVTVDGQCLLGEICCKTCKSVPKPSCVNSNGYCVKKRRDCPSGNIGCIAKGCKCCLIDPIQIPACQPFTEIFGDNGEVNMPDNGLLTYQDNLSCEWIIEVPLGYWISINFLTFDLEGNPPDCPWDYLEFSDGSPYPQWFGQKLCGKYEWWLPSFVATTNRTRVVFRSDVTVVKTGFSFTWTATAIPTTPFVMPSCQPYTVLSDDYGVVTVPDNGEPTYQNNQYCEWLIEVTPGFGIAIDISNFDLEGPFPECPYDYLQFFSGFPEIPWQSEKLCGFNTQIPPILAPTSQILAVFRTDGSVVGTGFTFTWYATEETIQPFSTDIITVTTTPGYTGGGEYLLRKKGVKDLSKDGDLKDKKSN